MVDILPTNLDEIIALRLELTQQERLVIRETVEAIDVKIKLTISHIGIRPKETDIELTTTMQKMEHTHATTIQTNALERVFMYDMKKLQEKKKYLVEYNIVQQSLDKMKSRRVTLQKELREKDATLDELYLGARKLKLAEKVGCMANEIAETRFSVPAEKLSQIIGKGGSMLQKIEAECKVSIDTKETKSSNIRITGTEAAIALAITAILTIVSAVTEEITLPDEKLVCLILDKAAHAHEIEGRNGVRIDISRAKKVCKVSGQPEGVRGAVQEIHAINASRIKIPIEITILPFIVGKGGATIKLLGDGNRVQIDIEREEKNIFVIGFRDEATRAATALLDIIAENTDVEEILKVDKNSMIGCIIGSSGNTVRALQKEFNVQMKSEKGEKGELDTLTIRGVTSKVGPAKARVLEMLSTYHANTEDVVIADDLMALVVGKKGAKISALREKFPDAIIDIEDGTVKIQSANPSTREGVRLALEEIVKSNHMSSIPVLQDIGIAMKGSRGNGLRTALDSLNIQFDIAPENESVKLRGVAENVKEGMKVIEEFCLANYSLEVNCHEDDFSTVFSQGNGETSLKALETGYDVEIRANRKDGTVRIRGEKSCVDSAETALEGLLSGDSERGSLVFPVQTQAFAAIIGKGGVTMKKFENDLEVKIDLLKARGAIRVRGAPDAINTAKLMLLRFVDEIKVNNSVDLETFSKDNVPEKNLQKAIEQAAGIYQVEIGIEKSVVFFRGSMYLVEEAKQYLKDSCSGCSSFSQPIPLHLLPSVRDITKDLQLIGVKNGVKVTLPTDSDASVSVTGNTESVTAAKISILKLLKHHLKSEFISIELPASCIKEMNSAFTFEVLLTGGCILTIDRPMKSIRLIGEVSALSQAIKLVDTKLTEWKAHHATIPVDEYMLPVIIGKNGSAISALQKDLHIKIHLNRSAMVLELESPSSSKPEVLQEALVFLEDRVSGLKQHTWSTVIDPSMIGMIVGKQGIRINKIRTDSGASIDINKITGVLELRGTEVSVALGKEIVMQILSEMPQTSSIQMHVPSRAMSTIIGAKGLKAQEITELSGARFDLDRIAETAVLKGSPEACIKLKELIEEILEKEGFNLKEEVHIEEVAPVQVPSAPREYKLVGATESMAAAAAQAKAAAEANMSKSAIRRRRRREQDLKNEQSGTKGQQKGVASQEEDDEDEQSEDSEIEIDQAPVIHQIALPTPPAPVIQAPVASIPAPAPAPAPMSEQGQKLFSSLLSVKTDFSNGINIDLPPGIDIVMNSPTSHGVIGSPSSKGRIGSPTSHGIIGRSLSSPHKTPTLPSPQSGSYQTPQVTSPSISRSASAESGQENSGDYNYFNGQNYGLLAPPSLDSNSISQTSISPEGPAHINQNQIMGQNIQQKSLPPMSHSTDSFASETTSAVPPVQPSPLGLLDMLLGYTAKSATTSSSFSSISQSGSHSNEMKAEQMLILKNRQAQEKIDIELSMISINNLLSANSNYPTHPSYPTQPTPAPVYDSQRQGYYKSKSGFSVRL